MKWFRYNRRPARGIFADVEFIGLRERGEDATGMYIYVDGTEEPQRLIPSWDRQVQENVETGVWVRCPDPRLPEVFVGIEEVKRG